jgi:WD40 repeat protein
MTKKLVDYLDDGLQVTPLQAANTMAKKLLKYLGWFCLFCLLLIGKIFITEILLPARNQPPATKPLLKFRLPSKRFFDLAFVPTREQPHPTKPTTISHLVQQVVSSLAFTPDGKQLLGLHYLNKDNEIKRWNIKGGTELPPIKYSNIRLLSDDGRFYVTSNFSKDQGSHLGLYRVSDQKFIAALPDVTQNTSLVKITAGANPVAIYCYVKKAIMDDPLDRPSFLKRGYSIWNIQTKRFISSTPYLTTLYGFDDTYPANVAFSNDDTKVLSLWPTYSANGIGRKIIYTKHLAPFPGDAIQIKPKEARLLNEINGKIIKLPFLRKNSYDWNFFEWEKVALSRDQKYYAAASNNSNGIIWCYDISNRQLKWKYSQELTFPHMLMFSPYGTMIAVAGDNINYRNGLSFLNVIDAKTGKLIHSYTEQTLNQQIRDRTGIYLLTKLSHVPFIQKHFQQELFFAVNSPAPGNSGQIQDIAWSPDSKSLAASYEDGSVKIWHVKE